MAAPEIDVWSVHLDMPMPQRDRLAALLSPAEQGRAARFRTRLLADRYRVAHGALRCLLAERLRISPTAVRFTTEESGKPMLSARHGPSPPRFNLSHSEDTALIALSDSGRFGIDIEKWRADIDVESIAGQYFAPSEARQILSHSGAQRISVFLTCWTRKEAYLKAVGAGLSLSLDSFEVAVSPTVPPCLVSIAGDRDAAADWSLFDLGAVDFAAALAVEARRPKLRLHRFQPPLRLA